MVLGLAQRPHRVGFLAKRLAKHALDVIEAAAVLADSGGKITAWLGRPGLEGLSALSPTHPPAHEA